MAEKYCSEIKDVHLSSNKYVLVLPGWYPTWQDPFVGDFNQRQVKAAGLQTSQVVLYIVKDQSGTLTETETRYKQLTEKIVEIIVLYPAKKNKWVDVAHSNVLFLQLLYKYASIIKSRWGKPELIHAYIVIRGGLGGLLLGKKWGLPFILSEHWTIYYPADPGYVAKRNFLFKWMVRSVYKNVQLFLPVTGNLKEQVTALYGSVPSTIVPNVVETGLFNYKDHHLKTGKFRFIHVSTMNYQKNPEGLLRAFSKFIKLNSESCLWMVGPYPEEVLQYARTMGLTEEQVHFIGSITYERVAEYLKASMCLVLFSRYENLPCVILEALCCGLPVVSTNVGGIAEVINSANGILINSEDEEQLTAAFRKMYTTYNTFNGEEISDSATKRFSYPAVGSLINAVYENITKPR